MAIINANTGNFQAQLGTLKAGDTLQLAAGNYGAVLLANLNFGGGITIKGGSFTSIALSRVSGVTFDGATVSFKPTATSDSNAQAIRIWDCDRVTITNAKVSGGLAVNGVAQSAKLLDATGNVLGLPAGKGINFENSRDCAITNSDISLFHKGITFTGSNLTISGNDIHDLRTTPISGSATSGLVITGNHSWSSHPWNFGGAGDHGDRIHIWTDKTAITGVVITGNLLEQGSGDPMLGIYLDDNGKGLGFPGAVITGNTVIDGTGQGMLLENVSGTVANNTLSWSGTGTAANNTPRFQVTGKSHDIVFTGNSGNVAIVAGARDLQFWDQRGSFTYDTALTAADRLSITQDATVITKAASFAIDAVTDNLTFAGTGNFTGTGNVLANVITGGAGNDTLIGNGGNNIITGGSGNDILNGGLGTDTLAGGLGDDTYYVNNPTQLVVDTGGNDTVIADRSYALGATIENLTLSGSSTGNLTGNALDNVLRGSSAGNIIDGGSGADTMVGGGGNDTYIVDNTGDRVIEVENGIDLGGVDTVKALLSAYTLCAGVENLLYWGTAAFTGTGNALDNSIAGAGGADMLYGLGGNDMLSGGAGNDILDGGTGTDRLTGGAGNDIFVFVKGEASGDSISDFTGNCAAAGDLIRLIGWGAGTKMVQGTGSNWIITDGIDHSTATIAITGAVHASDILYG
ncbi:right-handed parallel beta-helix repeat-containing protein [Polymorphobacter arshaanensis]|nr:right-handed parallel beta-helix repeat-containing protein [Polymorphobacter arshaanensis]